MRKTFALLVLLLAVMFTARGQSYTEGGITGTVADPSGGIIPGVPVTATSEATNQAFGATTDDTGRFLIGNLQPGVYDLSISAQGFSAYKQTNIVVEVGLVTTVEAKLAVSGQVQSVTVTAETAPLVSTEQSTFARNFNTTDLDNLPMNVRRWSYVALLTPGAVPDGTFGDIAFRGVGYLFDNNTVDGASNTQGFFAEEVGRTRMAYSTSVNSIQEFQVTTSNYSAEYGRAVGGVINAITKSGSNQIHGDLFYYNRDNSVGGAYAPFATGAVLQPNGSYAVVPIKPTDIRQQFGGDAGGPVIKNKLFWYFNFDDQIHHFPVVNIPTTPNDFFAAITVTAPTFAPNGKVFNAAAPCANWNATYSGSGIASGPVVPPGTTPTRLTPGQVLYCRGLTQAQVNAAQAFLDSTTGRSPRTGDQTIYLPKLDWHPNDKNAISLSYNRVRWASPFGVQTGSVVARSIDSNGNDYVHDDRAIGNWTTTISNSTVNELRFIYSRDNEFEFTTPSLPTEPVSPLTKLSPQVDLSSCYFNSAGASQACGWTLGAPYYLQRPAYPLEQRYQFADSLSFVKGKHFFKIGLDITRTDDYLNSYAAGDQLGEYGYSYVQDFISDYTAQQNNVAGGFCTTVSGATTYNIPCYAEYYQTFGPLAFNVNTIEPSFFVQDDWHVTTRLTLNLGLRWDRENFPSPVLPNPAIPQTTTFPSDNLDFAPRFGFAWDVAGGGQTVIRGGYGVFYGRISNEQVYEAMTQTGSPGSQIAATIYPTTGNNNYTGTPTVGAPSYPNTLATFSPSIGKPSIAYFPGDFRLPGAEEFDLVAEHKIAANTVISGSYLGSIGRFLPIGLDTNLPAPTTETYTINGGPLAGGSIVYPFYSAARPNPNYLHIVEFCTCVTSHYNAVVAQFNQRYTHGLQFNFSYTYSRATDDGASSSPAITSNSPVVPTNLALEEGTSYLNVPNHFGGTLIWEPGYFANDSNMIKRSLLSGWTFSLNQVAQTGLPFNASISGNVPSGITTTQSSGGVTGAATSTRAIFLPKNGYVLPPTVNTDILVGRSFKLHENVKLQLSVQGFNLFNHRDFTAATTTAYTLGGTAAAPTLSYQSSFNTAANLTAANNGVFFLARQLQFGGKITF